MPYKCVSVSCRNVHNGLPLEVVFIFLNELTHHVVSFVILFKKEEFVDFAVSMILPVKNVRMFDFTALYGDKIKFMTLGDKFNVVRYASNGMVCLNIYCEFNDIMEKQMFNLCKRIYPSKYY